MTETSQDKDKDGDNDKTRQRQKQRQRQDKSETRRDKTKTRENQRQHQGLKVQGGDASQLTVYRLLEVRIPAGVNFHSLPVGYPKIAFS